MKTNYVSPKLSAHCPECGRNPEQIRGSVRGERLCAAGHTFTLAESRQAERTVTENDTCPFCNRSYEECVADKGEYQCR